MYYIRAKHQGFLAQINVQHVVSIIGLTDIYNELAKAQHYCSKVNILNYQYYDMVDVLVEALERMLKSIDDKSWKHLIGQQEELKMD